jgi:L-alanine-DL-glutamate epimerase-like enolase superfamily enzyme
MRAVTLLPSVTQIRVTSKDNRMQTLQLETRQIEDVRLFTVRGVYQGPAYPPGERQAQALDIYPEFNARRGSHVPAVGSPMRAIYVEVVAEGGVTGIWGPIDETQAFVIARRLRPFLLGRDALATELLFDQMARLDRHGRMGLFMTAISAVDCALWDLKGKAWGQPVYRLLGGPTRPAVPAYASMLGFSVEPDAAATVAAEYQALGYGAQKWFFRHGPGDGERGMAQNLAMATAVRRAVGEGYPLMFDAFWAWDLSYAMQMVRALEPLRPFWMEEPIPPEQVGEFRKLRAAARVPLATGEHVYTRRQTKELLVGQAVDFLQNDPDWTGGISELSKIAVLASSFEVPLVAHGHSVLAALHVAGSQAPTTVPFVEYLIRHQPSKQNFHTPTYAPQAGMMALPTLPGLGLVLDERKIDERTPLDF